MTTLRFACDCGTTQWSLANAQPKSATRATCYCTDCQAFARHLGHAGTLDAQGGTTLNQCNPADIQLHQGADNVGVLRLSPKGLFRWHTTCCNTPMAVTAHSPGVPFTSLLLAPAQGDVDAALGTDQALVNVGGALGEDRPAKTHGMGRLVRRFILRAVRARLNGDWRKNPFFHPDRRPIATPVVLTKDERDAASTPQVMGV